MTVATDQGMAQLAERMAGGGPTAGGPGVTDGGAGLDVFVRLAAALESSTAAAQRAAAADHWTWEHVHPVEIPPGVLNLSGQAAAGVYDQPDVWGPRQGWAWRIDGIGVVLGSGATGAAVYLDSPNDPTNLLFSTNVSGRWEPARFYLMPGRRLVWQATGGPITVCKGNAEEIAIGHLPRYMGFRG